jgi:ATP-dependent RNA helicase RhlE
MPCGRAPQRPRGEVDGYRARAQTQRREVDGNRITPSRPEVDGNRGAQQRRPEADGNRRPGASQAPQGRDRRPAPRAALFSAKPGDGNR